MEIQIKGEYWIIDGDIQFADISEGDFSHVSYAKYYFAYAIKDKVFEYVRILQAELNDRPKYPMDISELEIKDEVDFEEISDLVDTIIYNLNYHFKLSNYASIQTFCDNTEIKIETFNTFFEGGDVTLYFMKRGWIALRGMNIEVYGWDERRRKSLDQGLSQIWTEEYLPDRFEPSEVEFVLEDLKSNKSTYITLADIENPIGMKMNIPAQTKGDRRFNYVAPDTTENLPQKKPEQLMPRKPWVDFQKKFTSENLLNFKSWLLNECL